MMLFYNIGIGLFGLIMRLAARFNRKADQRKAGLKDIFKRMAASIDRSAPLVWVHAASLGEFEQGRPVIEAIRAEHPGYRILLTFFSPSGYEVRKNYAGADLVFYLPIDTPRNARKFVQIARPQIAIFIKYEFWLNYLRRLRMRSTRTYVVSAIFHEKSVFFRRYGAAFRKALRAFDRIFVQNEESRNLLSSIGITRVTVSGDTRFDRVAGVAARAKKIEAVEHFAEGSKVLVAGSTWPPDEALILPLIARYPDVKFIIAPHETGRERIDALMERCPGKTVRYTDHDPAESAAAQVMVIDTIGILSSAYRYGTFGYIGGGFGAGIHNTLEAATFGLPVAFGPNYGRFKEARELIELGAAHPVADAGELDAWLGSMLDNPALLAEAKAKALSYVAHNTGATDTIMQTIFPEKPTL